MKKLKLFIRNILGLKPKFLTKPEFKIIHAFTIAGVRYYRAEDHFNNPYKRALTAVAFYNEYRSRVSREYLLEHVEANSKTIADLRKSFQVTSNKIDLNSIFNLIVDIEKANRYLKERLDFIIEPDLIYKLASVIFFDESESPYDYDMAYNQQKIKQWKKEMGTKDFFLQMPIIELVPYLKDSNIDFQSYSQMAEKIKSTHMEFLTSLKSKRELTNASAKK